MVLQEPQGAITNAVCALASLHCKRRRIAEGLESPDPNPDLSPAKLFYDGAGFQIASTKQLLGHYTENEAIAALHLITYSLLSGGAVDWRVPLAVGYDWLTQTGLPVDGNPILTMLTFGFTGRCIIKTIMVCLPVVIFIWLAVMTNLTQVVGYHLKHHCDARAKIPRALPASVRPY